MEIGVHRATREEAEAAFAIVDEYNRAVGVQVTDTPQSFLESYFGAKAGIWLASVSYGPALGCIALRALPGHERAGEVKRLYVQPEFRGQGVADRLLDALEAFAMACDYRTLYLDSKDDLIAALRFYARRGYQPCQRYNDNPQATVFLRKQIAPL